MRLFVRLLTCLFGLALTVAGALLALEVGWAAFRPRSAPLLVPWPEWSAGLRELAWADLTVQLVAGGAVLVGLLLLVFAALARRREVRMQAPKAEISVTTTPRSLARLVGIRVRGTDGVTGASVTASARSIRVRASSRLQTEHELRPRVRQAAGEVVESLPLPRKPKLSVIVNSPKDRT